MNDNAKVFAHYYTHFKTCDDQSVNGEVLNIYYDGLVVAVKDNADRHLAIRARMKEYPGFEEARLGNLSVFLVPMDVGYTKRLDLPPMIVAETIMGGYIDHRREWMTMMQQVLEAWKPQVEFENMQQ